MTNPRTTKSITRRTFVKTLGAAPAIAGLPLILHADDKAGSAQADSWGAAITPTRRSTAGRNFPRECGFGNTHMVQEDSQGRILIHHQNGAPDSVFIFDPDGKFIKSWGAEWREGAHGMQLRKEGNGRIFIFGDHRAAYSGENHARWRTVVRAGVSQGCQRCRPAQPCYENEQKYKPTNIAFAPNGDFYVADGYGSNFVHRYNIKGDYISTFGGIGADDGQLRTPHGIWCDTRGPQPKILVADRSNERLQWFDLDGKHLATLKPEGNAFRRPCHFDQRNGELLLPGLDGRVSILDADNKQVAILGDNADAKHARQKQHRPRGPAARRVCLAARLHVGSRRQHFYHRMGFRRPGHQAAESRRVNEAEKDERGNRNDKKNRSRQLLHRQLSAVFAVDGGGLGLTSAQRR